MVRQRLEVCFLCDVTNYRFYLGRRKGLHAPAFGAHEVMVVGGRA